MVDALMLSENVSMDEDYNIETVSKGMKHLNATFPAESVILFLRVSFD